MEYLESGIRLVWLIDPVRLSNTVYTADALDGGDILPGFSVSVAELFE